MKNFEVHYLTSYGIAIAGYIAPDLKTLIEGLEEEPFWNDIVCIKDEANGQIYADILRGEATA